MFRYRLPRLRGKGQSLSQQAGGVGTRRGPGETQLEIDRRRITRQIHKLEAELEDIARHRDTQRKSRRRTGVRHVVIVGYTNAGKSTLLNRLTAAGVLVEDRLFATLDATTRRLQLPGRRVGAADRHRRASCASCPTSWWRRSARPWTWSTTATCWSTWWTARRPTPRATSTPCTTVITEIGGGDRPELLVFNKADRGRRGRPPGRITSRIGRHLGRDR